MNAKNKFKIEVIKYAIELGVKPKVAAGVKIEQFVDDETGFRNFGATIGDYSFGGCYETNTFSYWPTASNDGTIESTKHIVHIR